MLLVDDEPSFLKMMARLLAGSGILVRQATSVLGARTILASEAVHLVCSDYEFGGGGQNGIDLLEEVGRRWPLVHRVLMTGYANSDWVAELPYLVIRKGMASPKAVSELLIMLARRP